MVMLMVLMVMVVDCGQGHLEYRKDYMLIVVVCVVIVLVLMVMVVDFGQGHLEYKQDCKLIMVVCMVMVLVDCWSRSS